MVQILHLQFILMLLTVLYPEGITSHRFRDRMSRPAQFSSEESSEMSSESSEEGYGRMRGPPANGLYYESYLKYAIVREEYIRPLIQFGSYFLLAMDLHFFGTFSGVKYYTIKENHGFNAQSIFQGGVLVTENRLRELYKSGKTPPRRLPLLYMGKRQNEDLFMIDKSYLDGASTGGPGSETTTTIQTATANAPTTRGNPSHSATVPSRDGGIPGRNIANASRFSRFRK